MSPICYICEQTMERRGASYICVHCDSAYRESQLRIAELERERDEAINTKVRLSSWLDVERTARDAALADAKALREDKERLDWLESNKQDLEYYRHEDGESWCVEDGYTMKSKSAMPTLRSAIDTARALTEGREG